MRILILAPNTTVLTGGGTYTANILRYLKARHDLQIVGPNDNVMANGADVAYAPNLMGLKPRLVRGLSCPLVIDVHDYYWTRFYPFWCPDLPLRYVAQRLRHARYSKILKRAALVIVHCQYVADRIDHANKHLVRVAVDYNATEAKTPLSERSNVILFVGQNYFRKGLRSLLLALPRVIQQVPDARLVIVGNERLHTLVVARWLARNLPVTFVGGVPRRRVAELYASSRVYVIPSEIEASPATVIEAGLAGTPVVATNVGGIPEMIQDQHSALIVPRGDIVALASSMSSLLTNLALATRLAEEARLLAMKRTAETMADEVLRAIESAAMANNRDGREPERRESDSLKARN
jgi:glycosyltransferase involved in cell wall biosynthesis